MMQQLDADRLNSSSKMELCHLVSDWVEHEHSQVLMNAFHHDSHSKEDIQPTICSMNSVPEGINQEK